MTNLALLELNELNFELLQAYMRQGELPNFSAFFAKHGYCETVSELQYVELEPWIQWVTAHTGKSFAEHGIFRLGDTIQSETPQIWEELETHGIKVGAISPMNAANRLKSGAFFLPDPWTPTKVTGSWLLKGLSHAFSQAVNDNASGRVTAKSAFYLVLGVLRYANPANYGEYLRLGASALARPWRKVQFLDLFLADLMIGLIREHKPQFCTLFVNGAAHLQHHYMLSSKWLQTNRTNPEWYIRANDDPVGDIYRTYDRILGQVIRHLPAYRIMLVTGLHQEPCASPIFYWRPRDHHRLLRRLGCVFSSIEPRMSRDFVIQFASRADFDRSWRILSEARIEGQSAFALEDRGSRIFVELIHAHDIPENADLVSGDAVIRNIRQHLAFVALKNGVHHGVGYFSDSGRDAACSMERIPLKQIHSEILGVFGRPARALR